MSKVINLDELKLENLHPNFQGSHPIYNFILNKQKYFFKKVPMRELVTELISMKVANHLGLFYLDQHVGVMDDDYGLLSKNYLSEGEVSYNLLALIGEYFYETHDEDDFFDYQDMCRLNNLEDIWFALEDRYPTHIVKKLMDGIVDIFLFDLIMGEGDRTLKNIEIIESPSNTRLAPLYDTSSIFNSHTLLGVDSKDFQLRDSEKLNKFLTYSDSFYQDRFLSFLQTIENTGISTIMDEVLEEGVIINDEIRQEISSSFQERLIFLQEFKKSNNVK